MSLTPGSFYSGAGAPSNLDGANGDHYRNTVTQDLWFKQSGIWNIVGNIDLSTPDGVGTYILHGAGTPFNPNGSNGDYYRNTSNEDLWFKQSGIWHLLGTLNASAAGVVPGTLFLEGSGVPSVGLGENGNYYRDSATSNVYYKSGGSWTNVGNWGATPPAGTTILTGNGVPSGALGANGNYYRDEDTEDIYLKETSAWRWVGSWASSPVPTFEVTDWNMAGAHTPYALSVTSGATLAGSSPNFEITQAASGLIGAGPLYLAGAEGAAGLLLDGTDTTWARWVKPVTTGGDNLNAVAFALYNSGATLTDLLTVLNGGTPTNRVWGAVISNKVSLSNSLTVQIISKDVITTTSDINLSLIAGDNVFVGYDQTTRKMKVQRNTGTIFDHGTLSLGTMPGDQTLKLALIMLFDLSVPVLASAPVVFDPATTSAGKTAFYTVGDATLPPNLEDGDVLKVTTTGGTFNGVSAEVGDFLQVYDSLTKVIKIRQTDGTIAGRTGDRYKIVSGIFRQTTPGGGWEIVDDASNQPVNISGLSVVGGNLRVTYGFTAKSIASIAVGTNGRFAGWGIDVGVDPTATYADISLYGDLGAEIMGSDGTTPVRSQTGLGLDITSQTIDVPRGTITVEHATQNHSSGYGTPVSVVGYGNNGMWTVDSRKDSFTLTYRRPCIGQVTVSALTPTLTTQIAYPADVAVASVTKSGANITGASAGFSGTIRVTLSASLGASPGTATISGTTTSGGMVLNGTWTLLPVDGTITQYDLSGSTFVGAWVSGGTITTGKVKVTLNDSTMDLYSGHVVSITGVTGGGAAALGEHAIQRIDASTFELDGTTWVNDSTPATGIASMVQTRWYGDHFEVFHPYAGSRQYTQVQGNASSTFYHYMVDTYAYPNVGFEVYVYNSSGALQTSVSNDMKFNFDRDVWLPATIPETLVGFVSRPGVKCDAADFYNADGTLWFFGIMEV